LDPPGVVSSEAPKAIPGGEYMPKSDAWEGLNSWAKRKNPVLRSYWEKWKLGKKKSANYLNTDTLFP
jgi:hypothetical protein